MGAGAVELTCLSGWQTIAVCLLNWSEPGFRVREKRLPR